MILRNPAKRRDSFFAIILSAGLFCLAGGVLSAQGIIGTVVEQVSRQPVVQAEVRITLQDSTLFTGLTDHLGRYVFETSQAGRIQINIQEEGFAVFYLADIILDGYTTKRLEHLMEKRAFTLPGVTVVAPQRDPGIFAYSISTDDMVVEAGHFDDPVRVAHSMPGIVLFNDQANHFSARGQSPVFNSWYLEGLEIVNPNHTNNAGTFSDQPTPYGGGINLFSAQSLGTTDIYTGLNPLRIGRSAGAVIDMHLHESAKPEFRAKAGLLGFELGGGAVIGTNGVLDVNLRYSFTGLLANLGVDFGGERIGFYDGVVSFRQQGQRHSLKVFGWAGRSINEFDRLSPDEEHERYKDFFDIYYDNDILGSGLRFEYVLSKKTTFRTGAAYSFLHTGYSRIGQFGPAPVSLQIEEETELFFATAEISHRPFSRLHTSAGIDYTLRDFLFDPASLAPLRDELFIRPYVDASIELSPAMEFTLGGEIKNVIVTGVFSNYIPGYRAVMNLKLTDHSMLYGGVRHGGGQNVRGLPSRETVLTTLVVDKYELGWNFFKAGHSAQVKTYYQQLDRMTVYSLENGFLHLADYKEDIIVMLSEQQSYTGSAQYYGIEASWEFVNEEGWRLMANQSLFWNSREFAPEGSNPGRYDSRYATHISLAREIIKVKKGKNRIWNLSLRGLLHGGLREEVIDPFASAANETTVYIRQGDFDLQLPAYKRIDLSIARTIANPKIRWRYSLDMQNVFGFANEAYHYYDPFLEQIVAQKQLGIIPVLSVQVSW